jgi:hypothetical protein
MNIMQQQKTLEKASLFAIGDAFSDLEQLIEQNEGEIDEQLDTWLKECELAEADKIDSYVYLINKFEDIAWEAQRLADRGSAYRNKAQSLKYRLKAYMECREKSIIETKRFTVKIHQNGGAIPVRLRDGVLIEDIPEDLIKQEKAPDMTKIREQLVQGNASVYKIAEFIPRGTHIRIK